MLLLDRFRAESTGGGLGASVGFMGPIFGRAASAAVGIGGKRKPRSSPAAATAEDTIGGGRVRPAGTLLGGSY